jgi:hypothetical protein
LPEIPPGNLRVLIEELHRPHARAGWPSTRTIARHQDFSHTSVEALTAIHRSIALGGGMTTASPSNGGEAAAQGTLGVGWRPGRRPRP